MIFIVLALFSNQSFAQVPPPPSGDPGGGDYCVPELYDHPAVGCPDCYIQQDGSTNCSLNGPCSDCFRIFDWTDDYLKLEIYLPDETKVKKIIDYQISEGLPDGSSGTYLEYTPYDGG